MPLVTTENLSLTNQEKNQVPLFSVAQQTIKNRFGGGGGGGWW